MNNKKLLEIKTAWFFPVTEYSVSTAYIEVRKASGIEYILLRLINFSENKNERLVNTLYNMGVPNDIHFIFGDALAGMVNTGLVEMKNGGQFETASFELYTVSDLAMTALGEKLFREGTIPTGKDGSKKLAVYYDPIAKNIIPKTGHKLLKFEKTPIDKKCFSEILPDKNDVEGFISENAGLFGFKKGETITGFRHKEPMFMAYKLDDAVNFVIDKNGMDIQTADKIYERYIRENYSSDVISSIIMSDKKFRFPDELSEFVRARDYSELSDIVSVKIPCMTSEALDKKVPLSLSVSGKMKNSGCAIDSETTKELFRKCGIEGCAGYFENGGFYRILPGIFEIGFEGYSEKCGIGLTVTEKMPEETADKLSELLYENCIKNEPAQKYFRIIKALTEIKNDGGFMKEYVSSVMGKQERTEDKARILISMHECFKTVGAWSDISEKFAAPLYNELCGGITLNNFADLNSLTDGLKNILNVSETEHLKQIYDRLSGSCDDMTIYKTFERADHNIEKILGAVNVFGIFCRALLNGEKISDETKLGAVFAGLGASLSELKKLTGINDPISGTAVTGFDRDIFFKAFADLEKYYKQTAQFKKFAREEFDRITLFRGRFSELKETMIKERKTRRKKQ